MTTLVTVTKGTWTVITGSEAGSLFLQEGSGVALTQAASAPITQISETPLLAVIGLNETMPYFGVASGQAIYGRSMGESSNITDTASV